MAESDEAKKLQAKVLADAATACSVALGKAGCQLGLYKAMGELAEEFEPAQLAERTGTLERYVRDWLVNQAATGYVSYNAETKKFYLNAAQKEVFTNQDSKYYSTMHLALVGGIIESALRESSSEMREGRGVPFSAHDPFYIAALAETSQSFYKDVLVKKWIPGCMTVVQNGRLCMGGLPLVVADIGCGYGGAVRMMAEAYNKVHLFVGFDTDRTSIEACQRLKTEKALNNCVFEMRDAHRLPAPQDVAGFDQMWKSKTDKPWKNKYDLVLTINTLHDMQDPLAAAKSVREHLEPTIGAYLIIEPIVKEPLEANFDVRGQFLSAASITWCTPGGLCARDDGEPKTSVNFGTLAPDSCYAQLAKDAGFSRFKKLPSETHRIFVFQV